MLEPGWVTDNHRHFDAFHIHFGFDSTSPQQLADVLQELKMHDKPLLYTVHDLRNPHQRESSPHAEQQEVLVAAAHTLITLTPGAAATIRRRWDRDAHVLPHPHVLDSARIERPRGRGSRFVLGVHAKSLRANMDPLAILDTLSAAVAELPDAILQIDLHDELFDPGNYWFDPGTGAALQAYGRHEHVRVRTHPYFCDFRVVGVPGRIVRLGAALPVRYALRLAGGLPRPGDRGDRPQLRVLRSAKTLRGLRFHRGPLRRGFPACGGPADLSPMGIRRAGAAGKLGPAARRARRTRPRPRAALPRGRGMTARLRIALIASNRFPIRQPFAGGLESHVWHLARALVRRGHTVSLFAGAGSDAVLGCGRLQVRELSLSETARGDVSMPASAFMADHHAYLTMMLELAGGTGHFDVVHNHSLHHLPVAMAPMVPTPVLTTVHTPPTPWLESALAATAGTGTRLAAVSRHTAAAWSHLAHDIAVVPKRDRHRALAVGPRRPEPGVVRQDHPREGHPPGHRGGPAGRDAAGAGRADLRPAVLRRAGGARARLRGALRRASRPGRAGPGGRLGRGRPGDPDLG